MGPNLTDLIYDYIDLPEGREPTDLQRVQALRKYVNSGKMTSFVPILPLIFNLNGQPYTLNDYFPLEPLFNTVLPTESVVKSGRQISKSTSQAARSVSICTSQPYFSILAVTPLYEQIRRFSSQYVKPFIEQSPLRDQWIGTGTDNSVLQKSFKNFSKMYFSFALTTADRVRGISASMCIFDEIQDIDPGLIPVIKECLSASVKWGINLYTGTPKTLDNTIEGLWLSSSQAEWCITCPRCKYVNVPKMGHDIEKMIGPMHDDISEAEPATICAKCRRRLSPRGGRWVHKYPELRQDFPGYHIPQLIMPMHYADAKHWRQLLAKREGAGNTTISQFYNEVLGESYEKGAKLITKTDLENASILPWANEPMYGEKAVARKNDYIFRVAGVDWGGGGVSKGASGSNNKMKMTENMTMSFTTIAVVGLKGDGTLDVIYGRRLLTPHDHYEEARQVMRIFHMFDCHAMAHDYNGAGALRETICVQAGMPYRKVAPMVYFRSAAQNMMTFHKGDDVHARSFWQLDKSRSLQFLCQAIKLKIVKFFKHDYVSKENRGLQMDFLSLMENKIETARSGDVYMIQRNPHFPDDFAHSVNFAASFIWDQTKTWPNLSEMAHLKMSAEQMDAVQPTHTWDEGNGFFSQP